MPRSRFRRAQRLVREVHRMGADLRILLFMLPCVPSSAMGQTAQHAESAERIVRLGGVVICNDREATAHVGIGRGWTGGEAGLALLKSLDNLTRSTCPGANSPMPDSNTSARSQRRSDSNFATPRSPTRGLRTCRIWQTSRILTYPRRR